MEHVTDVAKGFEQGIKGSGADAPQVGFEFGESHLDRIEIGAVGGQKQEPAASLAHGFGGARAFVCRQVVEDHDGSGIEGRGKLRLDVRVEGRPVHCAFDHPRCDQGVLRQPSDEGLCPPLAERCRAIEPFPDWGAPAQPREVGLDRRFVDEDQPVRLLSHAGLTMRDPVSAGLAQRGPITFRRAQSFFYMIAPPVRERGVAKRVEHLRHMFPTGQRRVP